VKAGYGAMSSIYTACYDYDKTAKDADGNEYHWTYADEMNLDEVNVDLGYQ
jgi:hypothetical protein